MRTKRHINNRIRETYRKKKSSIHRILKNANPTVETLSNIAKALDVDITELFIKKQVQNESKKYIECPRCGLKMFEVEG
ncbi:helix-turn-helix domain-containing protein [Bacteroides ovatus]|uniref:helix-turn-helix domain-containing protein n=1 Tax=Bacteroides ovatus TaxID=28116 RepID=UPI0033148569